MSRCVLGISAFYHDSAAAIVRDGEIVAAAQEERFSRKKHDPRFPANAINYCLEAAFIEASDLDAVVFYDHPLLSLDRILKNSLTAGEASREQFEQAATSMLGTKVWVEDHARRVLGQLGRHDRMLYSEHHMAHAASAFYPSPFERAAILTLDGVGEWCTMSMGFGEGRDIGLWKEVDYPHSLGLLYSAMTYYCGFKVNSGEYKLMGLAPYGEPRYYDLIRQHLIDVRPDGSFRLNTDYFGYLASGRMTNEKFEALFGGPARKAESTISRREMDLAASIQKVTEEVVLGIARHARQETGADSLVLAGGVALNCVANGKLLRERIFDHLWVQPAAGDAGGALGAALLASHVYLDVPRPPRRKGRDIQHGSYLGPAYSTAEVQAYLNRHQFPHEHIADPEARARRIATALAEGKIVGYLNGRMEYGPRSLGGRSILGDPRQTEMQSVMNLKIKYRESFRPFAPAVLAEDVSEYFEMEGESPYMLLVAPVRRERCKAVDRSAWWSDSEDMRPIINQPRSDIPAVTHVDYSARIQTVHPDDSPEFHRVLSHFKALTGCSVLVNTSFNVRGEPIVCSPQDAYRCFMRTGMDLLVLEDCLLWKPAQPHFADKEDWRTEYELD